jgi:hypothetical protein
LPLTKKAYSVINALFYQVNQDSHEHLSTSP